MCFQSLVNVEPFPRPIMQWSAEFYEKVFQGLPVNKYIVILLF